MVSGIIVLSPTYTEQKAYDHKTNQAGGIAPIFDVTMTMENGSCLYNSIVLTNPGHDDWQVDDECEAQIRVRNMSDTFNDEDFPIVFVRIQLKEYLEVGTTNFSKERLLYDTQNKEFVFFPSTGFDKAMVAQSLESKIAREYGVNLSVVADDLVEYKGGWYIKWKDAFTPTLAGKRLSSAYLPLYVNGGQPLQEGIDRATITSMGIIDDILYHNQSDHANKSVTLNEDGSINWKEEASDVDMLVTPPNGAECWYDVHEWTDGNHIQCDNTTSGDNYHNYVEWKMGADVVTLKDWIASGAKAENKWILDPKGWAYWGMPLEKGVATTNLMESIKLINSPEGAFYYCLHADMQAVSFADLANWSAVGTADADKIAPQLQLALETAYKNKTTNP